MTALGRIGFLTLLAAILLGPAASSRAGQAPFRSAEIKRAQVAEAAVNRARVSDELASAAQQKKLESVLGREVRTRVEEDGGRIIDVLVDGHGRVQAAVIEFGGFLGIGTRKIAVEWSAVRFETDGRQLVVVVDVTRDQLRLAPEYRANEATVIRRVSD